eukprot:9624990-Prorocentrum_lima.AAC.1
MTSSLVGSEMCIRDSFSTARNRQTTCARNSGLGNHQFPTASNKQTTWAVSYTHLTLPTICSV